MALTGRALPYLPGPVETGAGCFLAPEAPGSSHSLLWSWPLADAEKGNGAEAESCGSAQGMDLMKGLLEATSNSSMSSQICSAR